MRGKKSFFPLRRCEKNTSKQDVNEFFSLEKTISRVFHRSTLWQIQVNFPNTLHLEHSRGITEVHNNSSQGRTCLSRPSKSKINDIQYSLCLLSFYSLGKKVVSNSTVQYIFEHYITHFYVTGS